MFEIPLTSEPQRFSVTLAGVVYQMKLRWHAKSDAWILDIADSEGAAIVQGIPLVTGVDILGQYGYLGIGGQLIAQTDFDPSAPPSATNLGTTGHLYFVTS